MGRRTCASTRCGWQSPDLQLADSDSYHRYVYQEATDKVLEPTRRIEEVCARYGVPPGAAALQFSMRDKRITSTICGVSKPERVKQTLDGAAFRSQKRT